MVWLICFFGVFFVAHSNIPRSKRNVGGGEGEKEREQPGDGGVNEEGELEIHRARKEKE